MADLQIDIGANLDGLRKAMGEAGRMIDEIDKKTKGQSKSGAPEKTAEQKLIDFSKKDFTSPEGIATMIGGKLLGAITIIGIAIAGLIKQGYDLIKRYADEARELVNLSRAMNLTTQEIQKLKGAAIASGLGMQTLAKANAEFNKRAGEASLKGGDFLATIQRLGVNLNDIKNKTVKFDDVIKLLQKAHLAGTDAATMNTLANSLLGSSYQELLPLINRSSDAMKDYGDRMFTNTNIANKALERFSNNWDIFWNNIGVVFMEALGRSLDNFYKGMDKIGEFFEKHPFLKKMAMLALPSSVSSAIMVNEVLTGKSKETPVEPGEKIDLPMMQAALGANTLQQMGGGDIFGAVGWSPMQKMADDTAAIKTFAQQTAQNTGRVSENTPTNYSPAPNMNDK
jgi:hypothetical protein